MANRDNSYYENASKLCLRHVLLSQTNLARGSVLIALGGQGFQQGGPGSMATSVYDSWEQ
eukprot:scaffold38413_cov16-Prasinocladus_malaysianus.AAC.2